MADEGKLSSITGNKRKYEEHGAAVASGGINSSARRVTGFSARIESSLSDSTPAALPASHNSVSPLSEDIQLAKRRAQEIAARFTIDAEAKRPRIENVAVGEDASDEDQLHKPSQQIMTSQFSMNLPPSFAPYIYQRASKKIEIPNARVGVIIGKSGETIKYLQLQSGAKIQVTRHVEADLSSQTRSVELTGTFEQVNKAEQLINDVIKEAEAGGSGIISSRKFVDVQVESEQFVMKVPNNRVGLVIGKGGETIKNMQANSGARIQIIPLHLPPGDKSTERTVQIDGTKEQIELAKQLVVEVVSENRVRNPPVGGGYSQQGYAPRPPTSWAPLGLPPVQQPGYCYMQPGAYPGPPPQYNMSQSANVGYPPPSSSVGFYGGWDQASNATGPQSTVSAGYDLYNQQQPRHQQPLVAASSTPSDEGYNYGQVQSSAYSTQGPYAESTYSQPPTSQSQDAYVSGYHAPGTQTGYAHPSNPQPVYQQQNYGSIPVYGATAQDGSTSSVYGTQGGVAQTPPQVPPANQPPVTPQAYPGQQQGSTVSTYSHQGTGQPGYGVTPASQSGYACQSPAGYGQTAPLSQPSYVQQPHAQKTSAQPVYGQAQRPPPSLGYGQPAPAQPGYTQPPPVQSCYVQQDPAHYRTPSGFAGTGAQAGYGQQLSYGGMPSQQQGYTQPYGEPHDRGSSAGYSQLPAYSSDSATGGNMPGSYESSATHGVPSRVTKTPAQG